MDSDGLSSDLFLRGLRQIALAGGDTGGDKLATLAKLVEAWPNLSAQHELLILENAKAFAGMVLK